MILYSIVHHLEGMVEIFPTFNVAKCEASVAKVLSNSADYS